MSQGMAVAYRIWKRQGTDSPLAPSKVIWPCWHLDFRLLASRTMREYISIVLGHPVHGDLFWPPYETDIRGNNWTFLPHSGTISGLVGIRPGRVGVNQVQPLESSIQHIHFAANIWHYDTAVCLGHHMLSSSLLIFFFQLPVALLFIDSWFITFLSS